MGKVEVKTMEAIEEAGRLKGEMERIKLQDKLTELENNVEMIRQEAMSDAKIQTTGCNIAFNQLLRYAEFYKVKQAKEYRKQGRTWAEFCSEHGEECRTIDNILKDLRPVYENFSEKISIFLNMPLSKIRYLGKGLSEFSEKFSETEDGALLIDGQKIELTPENKDEIEAAIDAMQETHANETKALKADVKKYKNNAEKMVAEETKALNLERKALIERVDRLEKFAPDDKDPETWMIDQMKVIEKMVLEFDVACRRVVMDERIVDNMPVIGQVEGLMQSVELALKMLRDTWTERFLADWEE
jgi:hypothetical protein